MTQFSYRITDKAGIHARPAGMLVKLLQGYNSHVMISCRGKHVDGKKLFALMELAAGEGDLVTLAAEGADEQAAAKAAEDFFREHL